jgi:hypothetical protein
MSPEREILEKWVGRVADSYAAQSAAVRAPEPDPFCNPVGFLVRRSLSQLWEQLLGEMDPVVIDRALDAVMRLRAVQDISPGEAVGFVVQLRPLLQELPAERDRALLAGRVNQMAMAASDKYAECRQQIATIRVHEMERSVHQRRTIAEKGRE